MQNYDSTSDRPRTRSQRIGFWVGIILFVGLLICPTPESMRNAVRSGFAPQVAAETAQLLARNGKTASPRESAEYRRAERHVVDARAQEMMAAAAVTALVACWWMTVAIPIPVTSLLPLALFPLVGVMPIRDAAVPYANDNVFLFMGGFIIALAIERWGLHRRIALHIVNVIGVSRPKIVLGFMLASAFLSMWISNTAATLMMLPIGMAIISAVGSLPSASDGKRDDFPVALMLGIAYAAGVGGIATPIGTPPNIAFLGQYRQLIPGAIEISFAQWMMIFLPLVVVFLPTIWFMLTRITCRVRPQRVPVGREVLRDALQKLGPMSRPERIVLCIFVGTALLWMTRSIPIGETNYGWSASLERVLTPSDAPAYLYHARYINDATVALCMAVLLFVIPARERADDDRRLMNWETAQRLPWGILLLFGGGFSIAAAFSNSGLSYWCGSVFAGIDIHNPIVLVLATCLLMTFLTEITSNTATTLVMLPILAKVGPGLGVDPLLLMLPATISASCAFMLPVATPPNAIVFGSGHVEMKQMVRSGIIINLIGVVLVTAIFYFIARPVLGIDL